MPTKNESADTASSLGPTQALSAHEETKRLLKSLRTKQRKRRLPDLERFEGRRIDFKA